MDVKSTSEASKMLEAALQQMDGIISNASVNTQNQQMEDITLAHAPQKESTLSVLNNSGSGNVSVLNGRNIISASNVLSTAKTLALALQQVSVRIIFNFKN